MELVLGVTCALVVARICVCCDDGCVMLVIVHSDNVTLHDLPEKVPQPLTRNARKGNVRPLNAGYLADAAYTPAPPRAKPIAPPIDPPLTVAL